MKLKTALLHGRGTFTIYSNADDASRVLRSLYQSGDRAAKTIGVYEVESVESVPLCDIVGRLGHHWYIRARA